MKFKAGDKVFFINSNDNRKFCGVVVRDDDPRIRPVRETNPVWAQWDSEDEGIISYMPAHRLTLVKPRRQLPDWF